MRSAASADRRAAGRAVRACRAARRSAARPGKSRASARSTASRFREQVEVALDRGRRARAAGVPRTRAGRLLRRRAGGRSSSARPHRHRARRAPRQPHARAVGRRAARRARRGGGARGRSRRASQVGGGRRVGGQDRSARRRSSALRSSSSRRLTCAERELAAGLAGGRSPPPQLARADGARRAPSISRPSAFATARVLQHGARSRPAWRPGGRGRRSAARRSADATGLARGECRWRSGAPRRRAAACSAPPASPRSRSCAQPAGRAPPARRAIGVVDAAFVLDDRGLALGRRKVEVERDEALPRARLEVLQHVLVARVVGDRRAGSPARPSIELAGLVDRQDAPVVGQRMDARRPCPAAPRRPRRGSRSRPRAPPA